MKAAPYTPPRWLTDEPIRLASREIDQAFSRAFPSPTSPSVGRDAIRAIGGALTLALGAALYDALLAAWLHAASRAVSDADAEVQAVLRASRGRPRLVALLMATTLWQPPSKPPSGWSPFSAFYPSGGPRLVFPVVDRAANLLLSRKIVKPDEFYALANDLRTRSFTVSLPVVSTIEDIHAELVEMIGSGPDLREFVRRTAPEKSRAEVVDLKPDYRQHVRRSAELEKSHAEMVFRNNIHQAYSDGAESVLSSPVVGGFMPYRAYYAIHDDRVREEHLALESHGLDGTNVYHQSDPTWRQFRPPWSWNCRCGWNPLSARQAARKGVREAMMWIDTGVEPPHVPVPSPSFVPPPTWRRTAP